MTAIDVIPGMPAIGPKCGRIAIVVPALPPKLDGIGDYAALLAAELANGGDVTLFTDRRASAMPVIGANLCGAFDPDDPRSANDLEAALADHAPDWVVLQYNPFGWGRRGFNPWLPRAMHRLRRSAPRSRLAVMFHETFVHPTSWRFAIMTTYQRWQFYQLCRAADVLFFSVAAWAERFAKWFPGKPTHHLPVGSNIARVAIGVQEAKRRLGLGDDEFVLGVFGTAHESRLLGLTRSAADALRSSGRPVRVLYIGPDAATMHRVLGDIPLLCADGPLPADEVSRRLAAVDLFLATYGDGVSTRRGAMMAALQHGLPILGTNGCLTDPELQAAAGVAMALTTPANDPAAFAAAAVDLAGDERRRAELGMNALALFERRYAWSAIANNLLGCLGRAGRRQSP